MSVMIVTSLGDLVIDLHTDRCPLTTKNFLKLCKIKYYNGCLFHTVQKDFTAQTGDPTGTGAGGDSVYKFLYGDQARFFGDEVHLDLKHTKMGTVAMASAGEGLNASQFYITLRDDLDYLDGKHTVFGEVAEGLDTLQRINDAYVDEKNRPYKNIRIKHTCILDDPFEDPPSLAELIPDASPEGKPKDEVDDDVRLEDDWVPLDEQLGTSELEEVLRSKEAHSRAVVLESIGDIPDAEMKPPDTVLFVCKLNPVTEDEDLHTIFSRFGTVTSAEIIRDFKTGDSLCFAFIEFENKDSCEQAYFKMDNALIDDRRIHVDFSQSVAKLWSQYRRKDGAKGKGCFKCGAPDHMAKDCDGDSSNRQQQPSKYTLKDDNTQRGADRNSRYDMVFDEDTPGSPQKEKRRQDSGREEDHNKKQKVERRSPGDVKQKDHERYSRDRNRHGDRHVEDRRKEDRDSERNRESRPNQSSGSRRDSDYPRDRRDRDRERDRDRDRYSDKHDKKVDEYSKRKSDGDRDYRKRSSEKDDRGARREDGRRRASVEDDGRYKRDELRNRKENTDGGGRKEKREDRDDGRSRESGRSCDRDYDRRRHGDGRR